MDHLFDGTYDLVIVPAGAALEAYTGTGACEGERKEKLRAIAACYPIVSTWASPKELGLSEVQELRGIRSRSEMKVLRLQKCPGKCLTSWGSMRKIPRSGTTGSKGEPTGSATSGRTGSMRSRRVRFQLIRIWHRRTGSAFYPIRTKSWMRSWPDTRSTVRSRSRRKPTKPG